MFFRSVPFEPEYYLIHFISTLKKDGLTCFVKFSEGKKKVLFIMKNEKRNDKKYSMKSLCSKDRTGNKSEPMIPGLSSIFHAASGFQQYQQ